MRRLQPTILRLAVGLCALAALLSIVAFGGVELALLLAPAFVIAAPLVFGRYVGEDVLAALGNRSAAPLRAALRLGAPPRAPRSARITGGLLVARRLAGRAPPAAARCSLLPA